MKHCELSACSVLLDIMMTCTESDGRCVSTSCCCGKSRAKISSFLEQPSCLCDIIWGQSLYSRVRWWDTPPQLPPPFLYHQLIVNKVIRKRSSWTNTSVINNMTKHLKEKFMWCVFRCFSLIHVHPDVLVLLLGHCHLYIQSVIRSSPHMYFKGFQTLMVVCLPLQIPEVSD